MNPFGNFIAGFLCGIKHMTTSGSETPSLRKKISDAVKLAPLVGPLLGYAIDNWGISHAIFLGVGFVVGWGIVYWNTAPEFLVAGYKTPQSPPTTERRPSSIKYRALQTSPEWAQPYVFWLEQEGIALQKENVIQRFQVCYLEAETDPKPTSANWITEPFKWQLTTERDWKIQGYSFEIDKEGFFHPLQLQPGQPSPASIIFAVPKYRKDSKLFSIVSILMTQKEANVSCENLRSEVLEVK